MPRNILVHNDSRYENTVLDVLPVCRVGKGVIFHGQRYPQEVYQGRFLMLSDLVKDDIVNFFRISDANKDGCLSREEVAMIMGQVKGSPPTAREVDKCFNALDIDKNGSVSEDEFCQVIMTWLHEVTDPHRKKRSSDEVIESPSLLSRKKSVSEIANFFRQFSPVDNFQEEQIIILTRSRTDTDMKFLQKEFETFPPDVKSERHKAIRSLIETSRNDIMKAVMSLDWSTVVRGVELVHQLLSVVELFHSSQDRRASRSHTTLI